MTIESGNWANLNWLKMMSDFVSVKIDIDITSEFINAEIHFMLSLYVSDVSAIQFLNCYFINK
jgi:hypothetical protein